MKEIVQMLGCHRCAVMSVGGGDRARETVRMTLYVSFLVPMCGGFFVLSCLLSFFHYILSLKCSKTSAILRVPDSDHIRL